ncbi:MAG: hypothetical protein IPM18_08140 [Phycisphaerales bacterium]|nr:hypothetical protein [Phycisphaerales bacterium]
MLRRFRHRLIVVLHVAILTSGGLALLAAPRAWVGVLIATGGATLGAMLVGRLARRHLNATLGRLRRVADDIGHGLPVPTLDVHPGEDLYKLHAAVNLIATRLSEARAQEARLQGELRRRERLAFLGELAASVAHEVNNPLDGVQNCSRILRRSLHDPARTEQMLDLIDGGLERIELIVRRLLTLGREHAIRPSPTRLREVVASAIELVQPKIDSAAVQVDVHLLTADDEAIVDRALLEQVLVNLLLNAADSMPAGGPITVTVRPTVDVLPDGQPALCIDVADAGHGIAAEVRPHIFEPFFTTKTGGKGTGLGLAIAARIVDAHAGMLTVAPRPEGGSVFTVAVPQPVRPVHTTP